QHSIHEETETQPVVAATVARHMPDTVRRAAELRIIEPAAATQHTELPFFRPLWVSYVIVRVTSIPILAPLPQIAGHVVQSPRIGGECSNRRGLLSVDSLFAVAIDTFTEIVGLLRGNRFPEMEGRRRPCTAGVFPFRLGRQAVRLLVLVLLPQLLDE